MNYDGNEGAEGSVCNDNQMTCRDGTCVDLSARCDGISDCVEGEDESNCEPDMMEEEEEDKSTCDEFMFDCRDGTCIDSSKLCDGVPDCPNETDESFCPGLTTIFNVNYISSSLILQTKTMMVSLSAKTDNL